MDSPPLRVLHVLFSLDAGGMENGVVNVSAALPASEFEVHACCLARAGAFRDRFPDPTRVTVLGKREGFSPAAALALARHIRRLAPDIVHTHNFGPLIYTALAIFPARRFRIVHGEHAELTPSELAPHRRLLRRLLYRRADRIHTVSHSLRRSLVRQGFPGGRIEVIVNGVDTARFRPGPREEARRATGLPPHGTILGLAGRFGPYKRHAALIEAFERLAPADPALSLLFIGGGGPLEKQARERAAAGPFASRIHFAGFQREPGPWYRALDLLVIPSVNEGMSNVLLEAMASGIPALGHTACGNEEVIEDSINGYLRDIGSVESLRAALAAILASPDPLAAMGRAARQTVETRYSLAAMVAGYRSLYRSMDTQFPRLT